MVKDTDFFDEFQHCLGMNTVLKDVICKKLGVWGILGFCGTNYYVSHHLCLYRTMTGHSCPQEMLGSVTTPFAASQTSSFSKITLDFMFRWMFRTSPCYGFAFTTSFFLLIPDWTYVGCDSKKTSQVTRHPTTIEARNSNNIGLSPQAQIDNLIFCMPRHYFAKTLNYICPYT